MFFTYDTVQAEHDYRAGRIGNDVRKGRPARLSRKLVSIAVLATAALAGVGAAGAVEPDTTTADSGPNQAHRLATSWQELEPSWQPDYRLLDQLLNGRGGDGGSSARLCRRTVSAR